MKLVFNVPLGLDIGQRKKCAALEAGITATAATAAAALSANAANVNSHQGRVYARWALHKQEEENQRARDWTAQQNQIARQWEEQMYNLYNSPSAMMRQYRQAGVNPYLTGSSQLGQGMGTAAPMSGQGASGLSPDHPQQFMPDFSPIGAMGRDVVNALAVSAEVDNVNARTRETDWKTYMDLRYRGDYEQATQFAKDRGLFVPSRANSTSLFENMVVSQVMKDTEQGLNMKLQNGLLSRYGDQKAEKELKVLDTQVSLLDQQVSTLKSQEDLNYANGRKVASEIAKNFGSAARDYAVAGQLNALKQFLVYQASASAGLSSLEYLEKFADFTGNELVRDFITSDKGKLARKYRYVNTPEGNFALGFADGLNQFLKPLDRVTPMLSPAMRPGNVSFQSYDWNSYIYRNPY